MRKATSSLEKTASTSQIKTKSRNWGELWPAGRGRRGAKLRRWRTWRWRSWRKDSEIRRSRRRRRRRRTSPGRRGRSSPEPSPSFRRPDQIGELPIRSIKNWSSELSNKLCYSENQNGGFELNWIELFGCQAQGGRLFIDARVRVY